MADAFTAKNWPIGKAPARVKLEGDKTKRAEPAQHVIEFPGGSIELSRTSDGEYWAHIAVNREWGGNDGEGRTSALGEVSDMRIDYTGDAKLTHIAIRIRSVKQ